MGNDTSKSTIENQQLIMQLQNQLLQQQNQSHNTNQNQYNNNSQPRQTQQNQQYTHRNQLPVISPAELLQKNMNHPLTQLRNEPQDRQNNRLNNDNEGLNLLSILGNKDLMREIDKNPRAKRKMLEKLLNEHRHIMTSSQVSRISQILDSLPPLDNSYNDRNRNNNYASSTASYPEISSGNGNGSGFNQGTTPLDNNSRQLQKTQQIDTISALTKHYKTEAEAEEAAYKIEEEKRRREFAEKQRQRRMQYQSTLSDLEKSNVDSLRLFQLQSNYTLEELKVAYKKLAMKTHPDKTGGNAEQFQLVTKCYMSLLEKHKNRETEKPFNDLRTGSKNYLEEQAKQHMKNINLNNKNNKNSNGNGNIKSGNNNIQAIEGSTIQKDNFDAKLFNKIYEQNKLWESGDDGYGDWFKSNETDEAPNEIFGNKFNLNVFNSTFEDYKEKVSGQTGAIQQYKDPESLVSTSTGFTDIDIYARKLDDFSKPLPTGKGGKNDLAYTDLKTAYTGRGAFIDPNTVDFKTYKSVDELKRDRGNIRYEMTPEQQRDYEMKKIREKEEEDRRQELVRQRDTIVANSYSKIHEKMLGYKGDVSY